MKEKNIIFILVQIDEAHSSEWPVALENQPEPQKNIGERLERANAFVQSEQIPFPLYVDVWSNEFAETYRAWPDKYYLINSEHTIVATSEYGNNYCEPSDIAVFSEADACIVKFSNERICEVRDDAKADAVVAVDCLELITKMINE